MLSYSVRFSTWSPKVPSFHLPLLYFLSPLPTSSYSNRCPIKPPGTYQRVLLSHPPHTLTHLELGTKVFSLSVITVLTPADIYGMLPVIKFRIGEGWLWGELLLADQASLYI